MSGQVGAMPASQEMTMRLLSSFTALLLISGAALAQPAPDQAQPQAAQPQMASPPHMNMKARFEAANTSNDGKLTLDQARAAHLSMVVHHFDQIDAEHKGYVTLQDMHTWHQARHQTHLTAQQQTPQPQAQ